MIVFIAFAVPNLKQHELLLKQMPFCISWIITCRLYYLTRALFDSPLSKVVFFMLSSIHWKVYIAIKPKMEGLR